MDYKGDKLDELIFDLLSVIYDKGCEASRYAKNAGIAGKHQDELAGDLRNSGLNGHEAGIFLSKIGFLILPSINAVCRRKRIKGSRPYIQALYFHKEDIAGRISKGIGSTGRGHREYLEEMAGRAAYFKHIFSKGN